MNIELLIDQETAIVYDRDTVTDPAPGLFEPETWRAAGRLTGSAPGRGAALFLEAPFGAAVLRPYRRGGWAARLSADRYVFLGIGRSRSFREFRLLAELARLGLPVPVPLAAMCRRSGCTYRAALLTRAIPDVITLADALVPGLPEATWEAVGTSLRRFHEAGVQHADLNARNILLQPGTGRVFLVDFDRGRFTPGRPVNGRRSLARLRRSLLKWWPNDPAHVLERCWQSLEAAYHG